MVKMDKGVISNGVALGVVLKSRNQKSNMFSPRVPPEKLREEKESFGFREVEAFYDPSQHSGRLRAKREPARVHQYQGFFKPSTDRHFFGMWICRGIATISHAKEHLKRLSHSAEC